jgi:uncharacterized membrane protein
MRPLAAYVSTVIPFVLIDLIWLGIVAKSFYRRQLGSLMAEPIQILPAAVFYLGHPIGIVIFAVLPALASGGSLVHAAGLGALFGLFCYGTYDLVNLSTLKGWPLPLTIVDMAWGTILTAAIAIIGTWWMR